MGDGSIEEIKQALCSYQVKFSENVHSIGFEMKSFPVKSKQKILYKTN